MGMPKDPRLLAKTRTWKFLYYLYYARPDLRTQRKQPNQGLKLPVVVTQSCIFGVSEPKWNLSTFHDLAQGWWILCFQQRILQSIILWEWNWFPAVQNRTVLYCTVLQYARGWEASFLHQVQKIEGRTRLRIDSLGKCWPSNHIVQRKPGIPWSVVGIFSSDHIGTDASVQTWFLEQRILIDRATYPVKVPCGVGHWTSNMNTSRRIDWSCEIPLFQ